MKENFRIFRPLVALMAGWIPVVCGLTACKPETIPEEKPFVRLLTGQTYQSRILKRSLNYSVLLPKEYEKSNSSFPVVYLLHGYGDDETSWYKWGLINYYVDQNEAATVPMIYVMPEGFNTYWVNKYNGNYPFMDVIVNEFVPTIDSLFRTIPDPQHRAVMGYSMGGYGALILPAKNPAVFKTGVVLSMSFRTDRQYIDEPQGVFDSQWGSVFGGIGTTGTARLTDYYKEYSPFYFFRNSGNSSRQGQNYFFDCGDDEESLSEPNNQLHDLMRDLDIRHEYRVRNGGHSWDYWRKSLPEALKYIGNAVRNLPYPDDPEEMDPGPEIPANRIIARHLEGSPLDFNIMVPTGYDSDTVRYPVIYVLHDRSVMTAARESQRLYSRMGSLIAGSSIPGTLVVEIPLPQNSISLEDFQQVIRSVSGSFRTNPGRKHGLLIGNGEGGRLAFEFMPACSGVVNACMLFDANLPDVPAIDVAVADWYLDISDEGRNYLSYHALYMTLRANEVNHEFRVRQGTPTHSSFLVGLFESGGFIKNHL
jgi:enterochelin esterase-like enzyme